MLGKLSVATVGIIFSTFVVGRVASLGSHRGLGGSIAWAQTWDDTAEAPDAKTPPPDISGSYSGPADDHRHGAGTISAMISQTGAVLSGTWETDIHGGASGTLTGTVKSNGSVKMRLTIGGHCGLNVHGIFEHGDEITGVYHVSGCGRKPDFGTFDITD
jgi:hypothetical protein